MRKPPKNNAWGLVFNLLLLLAVLCGGWFIASDALAQQWTTQPETTPKQGGRFCPERYDGLAGRVVSCIQDIVIRAVENFLDAFMEFYTPIVTAALILAVTLYGLMFTAGTVRKPTADTFVLALKIGAVAFFTLNFGNMTPRVFDVMEGLVGIVSSYGLVSEIGMCSDVDNMPPIFDIGERIATMSAWDKVDCTIISIFGITTEGSTRAVGVISLIGGLFFTGGIGFFIFLLGFAFTLMLLVTVVRAIKVYLSAVVAVGFLICVSPIMIPCILFKSTKVFFDKWLNQMMCNMMIPIFIMAYISMLVAAIDAIVFRGPSSLYYAVAREPSQDANFDFDSWLYTGIVDGVEVARDVPGGYAIGLMGYRRICNGGDQEAKDRLNSSIEGVCDEPDHLNEMITCAINPWVPNEGISLDDDEQPDSCLDLPTTVGENNGNYYYGFMKSTQFLQYSITPGIETDADRKAKEEGCGWNPFCWLGKAWDLVTNIVGWVWDKIAWVLDKIGDGLKWLGQQLMSSCKIMSGIASEVCSFFAGSVGKVINFVGDVVHKVGDVVAFGSRLLMDGILAALGLDHLDGWFDADDVDVQKIASYRCKMDNPGVFSTPDAEAYILPEEEGGCAGVRDILVEVLYVMVTAMVVMYLMLGWLPMIPIIAHALTDGQGRQFDEIPGEHMVEGALASGVDRLFKRG